MLFRFSLYGFLKNQRYFEPFLMLVFLERGMSFTMIGWLIACRAVTINLLEIPSGAMADSLGRRRIMMGSFVAYLLSFLTFGLAKSPAWFVPAMVLFGIGDSFRTGTHKAMIFEWLRIHDRTDDRTKIYGYTRSWSKYGSAVSGILAALFVLVSDGYQYVFLFAAIPCLLNLINFAGYPRELDGTEAATNNPSQPAWAAAFRRAKATLSRARRQSSLRRLLVESMSWEGVFHAAKDYLQPVLAALAVAGLTRHLFWLTGDLRLTETQQTALLVGPVYALLFFLSGIASRWAYRIPEFAGSVAGATRWLWIGNGGLFVLLTIAGWFDWLVVLALTFVLLHLVQNLWRPILISRFDDHAHAEEGATMLSIESQAQRLATMVLAPMIGWMVDAATRSEWGGSMWPVGLVGLAASAIVLTTYRP